MGCYTQEVKLNVIVPSHSYFIKTEKILVILTYLIELLWVEEVLEERTFDTIFLISFVYNDLIIFCLEEQEPADSNQKKPPKFTKEIL